MALSTLPHERTRNASGTGEGRCRVKTFRLIDGFKSTVKRVLAYDVHHQHACLVVHSIHGPDSFDLYDWDELELSRDGVPGDVRAELRKLAEVVTGEDHD